MAGKVLDKIKSRTPKARKEKMGKGLLALSEGAQKSAEVAASNAKAIPGITPQISWDQLIKAYGLGPKRSTPDVD
jgi:hypothetical protein